MEPSAQPEVGQPRSEVIAIIRLSALALTGFAVLYILFLTLDRSLPFIKPGDGLVADMKHGLSHSGNPFHGKGLHVMTFGNSKMLAGFIPAVFDHLMDTAGVQGVESYNFGVTSDTRFVADLEAMAVRGTAPDIALLTFPWPEEPPPTTTLFHFIQDDQLVTDELFPFQKLLRNLFVLATRGHSPSGMRQVYLESERSIKQVAADRGYYFIIRQSHFVNDELPPAFHLPTDTPGLVEPRNVILGQTYKQLAAPLAVHKITCLLIPQYHRQGEYASPAAVNQDSAMTLAHEPNVHVVGPDYWLYPNSLFSDALHANKRGAEVYTRALADLLATWLKQHPSSYSKS